MRNIREPLKRPRPLKSILTQPKDALNNKARADLLSELEILNVRISNCDLDEVVTADISEMCILLKKRGEELDATHKDALDRYFCTLRNACREDRLDVLSRLKVLEIIEMRAMHWKMNENLCNYFNSRYSQLEEAGDSQNLSGSISPNTLLNVQNQNLTNVAGISLAPGELLRSSGKFTKPTKIVGKNYFKDEIVIRNCDSGKVNAGARDRLVQITGPHEEAIGHAKFLVEDTIKRNVSPVRDNISESTLDNKDAVDYGNSFFDRNNQSASKRNLMHSYSMTDAFSREISIPLHISNDVIFLRGTNPDLLKTAKNVLMEYFSGQFDTLEKDSMLPLTRSASSGNNSQRFTLKKQVSLKDNVSGMFSSAEQPFSQRSSSSASWSSDEISEKDSSDHEPAIPPPDVPIPPPSYPCRHLYSRQFLLECAQLPLSKKIPQDFELFISITPEIKPQSPIMFDPSPYLQNERRSQ